MTTLEKTIFQDEDGNDVIFRVVSVNGILSYEKAFNLTYTLGLNVYETEKAFRMAIKRFAKRIGA